MSWDFADQLNMFLSDWKEYQVFKELLRIVPGLQTCLMESSETDIIDIAELVSDSSLPLRIHGKVTNFQIQKGANRARANDMKGMKSTIIDWITPKGQSIKPHIPQNVKAGRGFNHERTGVLLCPTSLNWNNLQ